MHEIVQPALSVSEPFTLTRREVREFLKAQPRTTLVCAIVSHARGKLHARSYKMLRGGWRTTAAVRARGRTATEPLPRKVVKMYQDQAAFYYAASVIENLEDQADLILALIQDAERTAMYTAKWAKSSIPPEDQKLWAVGRHIVASRNSPR